MIGTQSHISGLFLMLGLLLSVSVCEAQKAEEEVKPAEVLPKKTSVVTNKPLVDNFLSEARVAGVSLKLVEEDGQCAVQMGGMKPLKRLDVGFPCGFVRMGKASSAQTYHYDGVGHVLLVAGPSAEKGDYSQQSGVDFKHQCSNQGQAIILQGKQVLLRKMQDVPLGFCHLLGFDEKVFYGYAFPID